LQNTLNFAVLSKMGLEGMPKPISALTEFRFAWKKEIDDDLEKGRCRHAKEMIR